MTTGDHPIYDQSLTDDDVIPRFIEMGDQVFEVSWDWKTVGQYHGEEGGWVASTSVDGREFSGRLDSKLRSLFDLADQLNRSLDLKAENLVTELPMNIHQLITLINDRSR
jgi:hypothetical protein